MSEVNSKLLSALRLDSEQRDADVVRSPQRRGLGVAAALASVVAAAGAAAWWVFDPRDPRDPRARSVQTVVALAPSESPAVPAVLQATGYVTARRRATVSAQITGTLVQVLIEEGDRVRQGQVLARLEDSALRAALGAAQANARTLDAHVALARAQLAQAQADARREGELAASGMVSSQAAERAYTAATTAAAQLEARRREAEAARAQLAQAEVHFEYTVIRAPFAGVVTEKAAQVGEIVSPNSGGGGFTRTGIGTIVDMDSLEVDVDVNEANLGQVKAGMPAEATLTSYPDWKIAAHVVAIVPTADRGKATVRVRVRLEEKDARILPDVGVRVSFLGGRTAAIAVPQGVLVPSQALAQRDGVDVVFVAIDGKAVLRKVKPAAADFGALKLLPEGVAVGERVVVAPPAALADGARIKTEEGAR